MWRKAAEMPRIAALRREVHAKMPGLLFASSVDMELEIRLPEGELFRAGDLDNFVTGVFDGLMAANGISSDENDYATPEWAGVHPRDAVALEDDARIVSLVASKTTHPDSPSYTLVLRDHDSSG